MGYSTLFTMSTDSLIYGASSVLLALGPTESTLTSATCGAYSTECGKYFYAAGGVCKQDTCSAKLYLDIDGRCKSRTCEKYWYVDSLGQCKQETC